MQDYFKFPSHSVIKIGREQNISRIKLYVHDITNKITASKTCICKTLRPQVRGTRRAHLLLKLRALEPLLFQRASISNQKPKAS